MTIERINVDMVHLQFAFTGKERPYLQTLANLANAILPKMINGTATKEEKLEYHALKWALKQLGALEKQHLEKINE